MIIYQIYPRSFSDSNHDGIGDLPGITAKLDYIQSLGVDMIWIGPFFKSPMRDFGYDVSDYRDVDPIFGTLDDFRYLLKQARQRGIGVMIDMVMSHTSDEHPWFKDSRHKSAGRDDWYLWADPKRDGTPPNNWMSVFGGPAWQWDAGRRQYYFHTFLPHQPDLNLHCRAVQDQVLDDMEFWLKEGVAGFRLDACIHLFQDLELRDNPPIDDASRALHPYGWQEHEYDKYRPEVLPFLERVRVLLDAYGAFSIGEVGGDRALPAMGQYTRAGRLHAAYSFDLIRSARSDTHVRRVLTNLKKHIKAPGLACIALSNHDVARVATRWGEGREPVAHAKQMLALLACMHGVICLYQGEELGLPQAEVPFERLQDPFGKTFWPKYKGRDGCRTPMPWTGEAPWGGFSTAEPWLPVDPHHLPLSVEQQDGQHDSILAFAREIMALRQARPELKSGELNFLKHMPRGVLAFSRMRLHGDELRCVFNLTDKPRHLEFALSSRIVASQCAQRQGERLTLEPSGFCLYEPVRVPCAAQHAATTPQTPTLYEEEHEERQAVFG
jgi:alpha-glucosidase